VIDMGVASGTETPAYEQSFDEVFLEMGAQGQSMFDTAGDAGAYDDSDELGTTNLDVDNPGDSPWATTAGGTTLAGTIPLSKTDSAHIPVQRAWGWDWLWQHFATFGASSESYFAFAQAAGGGGSFSADIPMPLYQRPIPGIQQFSDAEYLTPIDPMPFGNRPLPTQWAFNPAPSVSTGTGRAVPDVSTDADPFTGYAEYFTGFKGNPSATGSASGTRPSTGGPRARTRRPPVGGASADNTNLFYTGTQGHLFNPPAASARPTSPSWPAASRDPRPTRKAHRALA
jgi:kumamolisin